MEKFSIKIEKKNIYYVDSNCVEAYFYFLFIKGHPFWRDSKWNHGMESNRKPMVSRLALTIELRQNYVYGGSFKWKKRSIFLFFIY